MAVLFRKKINQGLIWEVGMAAVVVPRRLVALEGVQAEKGDVREMVGEPWNAVLEELVEDKYNEQMLSKNELYKISPFQTIICI